MKCKSWCITDFRFLNSRLQRVNFTCLLFRDAFAILGNFTCEYLLVLYWKIYIMPLNYHKVTSLIVVLYLVFSASNVYRRMPVDFSINPAIWQSYINATVESIPDSSKYLANIDDFLLHSSKHGYLKYLEDVSKVCLRMFWNNHPRSVNPLELNCITWITLFL